MKIVRIWLDDERPAPKGWLLVKSAQEMISILKSSKVFEISLDNDLGLEDQEGYDVVKFLEEAVFNDNSIHIPIIHVHTANPVARQKMLAGIENIKKFKVTKYTPPRYDEVYFEGVKILNDDI